MKLRLIDQGDVPVWGVSASEARAALENVAAGQAAVGDAAATAAETAVKALLAQLSAADAARELLVKDIASLRAEADKEDNWVMHPGLVMRNLSLWNRCKELESTVRGSLESSAQSLAEITGASPSEAKDHWWDVPLEWMDTFHDWFEPDDWLVGGSVGTLAWLVKTLEKLEITDELQAQIAEIKSCVASLPPSFDDESARIEDAWIAWGLLHGGESYVDPDGGPCGNTMVCIIGHDIPTGPPGNAITLGRTGVFNRKAEPGADAFTPTQWHQFHEYAHVVDQADVGVKRFLTDYADEAQLALATGGDVHDDSLHETTADLRAYQAVKLSQAAKDPYSAFDVSLYGAGYQELDGNVVEWWAQEQAKKLFGGEEFSDRERRQAIADAMGIDPSVDKGYFG